MANVATNPWSFTTTDVATGAITAATGLTLNPDGTVTVTTTAALNFTTNPEKGWTVINPTNLAYRGFYIRLTGVTGGTSFVLVPQFKIPAGTAQSGAGTLAECLWRDNARFEDMSWQDEGAAGQRLILYDSNGFLLWSATAFGAGFQNRGKLFWVHGLTPLEVDSGNILVTVN